jgi:hypothetical protein
MHEIINLISRWRPSKLQIPVGSGNVAGKIYHFFSKLQSLEIEQE